MTTDITVFDRAAVQAHRNRAAPDFTRYDFLFREVANRLVDKLHDVARTFPLALDLGCHTGQLDEIQIRDKKIGHLVQTDLSAAMVRRTIGLRAVADEEALPFADASFDLVVSNLSLHWANDLPGALIQVRKSLKPDGLFLAALLGGDTLHELRDVLLSAELDVTGGASPRLSPMADLRDLGGLLQRASFALPVVDSDRLTLTYGNPFALLRELRGLGEANATAQRPRHPTRRAVFETAARLYHERYADQDGRVPATFDVIYLTAWAPHESQQRPLAPGSAKHRLADTLDATEQSTGEKARPDR